MFNNTQSLTCGMHGLVVLMTAEFALLESRAYNTHLFDDRLTLEAMTRVLPKDGRGHQSHTIYSYLCRHGVTLAGHVDELLEDDNMKRRQTPLSIMVTN